MKTKVYQNETNVIHKRLMYARQRKGVSQQQLSEQLAQIGIHLDQRAISRIEKNKQIVTDFELFGMCEVLGVSPTWLGADYFERKDG